MEEYLDIYDKGNNPTGTKELRAMVHKNGSWHRTVHIYVINKNNDFLVHLRSPFKDLKPDSWDTRFGGHVRSGKDYDGTALDELYEEIGIKVETKNLVSKGIASYDSDSNKEHVKIYFYEFNGSLEELKFNDEEVVNVRWMSPKEIEESMTLNKAKWASSAQSFERIVHLL